MAVSSSLASLRQLLRQPAMALWALYILLTPLYIVHNGLPQPGDLLIVVLFPISLVGWNGRLDRSIVRIFRPLVWFTIWVSLVDYTWAIIIGNFGLDLLFPVYYIYNAIIFLTAMVLYQRFGDQFIRLTAVTIFWTVLAQVALSFVIRTESIRGRLFFSNPNQLGYYALLAGCIIALSYRRVGWGLVRSSIGLSGCAYLSLLSASRSAVAGTGLLLILIVFQNPRVIAVGAIAAISLMVAGGPIGRATESLQERVAMDRAPELSFFEQRGYDRIWANKEYLLLGAAEGANSRFEDTTAIGQAEIHSSAGTLLFSYGIVGAGVFLLFMWRLMRGATLRASLMLLPPLTYTFAHQGLRFTTLWVLLAVFVTVKPLRRRVTNPPVSPTPVTPMPSTA